MMAHRVCPWWLGYWLISPLRKWRQDPRAILSPYVRSGMTVLEPGPGMGFFTIELARLVGPSGRVIAIDMQPKMLDRLKQRAEKAGVAAQLDARLAAPESMGLDNFAGQADFALAFAVVHEFPSYDTFFRELAAALKSGGSLLVAEPKGHVRVAEFEKQMRAAAAAGFALADRPQIAGSHAALLKKASG